MENGQLDSRNLKEIIASNLQFLMLLYDKSRKEVCSDLDIRYTTFTDWVKGNTYPRMDALELLGYYFRVNVRDFFIEISRNESLTERLTIYAKKLGVQLPDGKKELVSEEPSFTVVDYYETPEGYPVELLEGKFFICESPSVRHQAIVVEITSEIRNYIRSHKGKCRIFSGPFDVELPTKKGTVVVPDVTVVCDPDKLDKKGCKGAPDWIIEVVSENHPEKDFKIKKELYEKSGVREYWIVDQFHDKVYVYHQEQVTGDSTFEDRFYFHFSGEYDFTERITSLIYPDFTICMSELMI